MEESVCLKLGGMAMDSELRARISGIVLALAEQEQGRLRRAGTFVELEELACQIGDEVTRQVMSHQLTERCDLASESEECSCPDCDQKCLQSDPEHRRLTSTRGELSYHEPSFYCHSCRRSFFPGGRNNGSAIASHGHSEDDSKDGLGREQSE